MIGHATARAAVARACPLFGLALCALLAPIVAQAAALRDGTDAPEWIVGLSGLHEFATELAGADVYRSFGLISPLIYVLLLTGLWLRQVQGTRFLQWVLAVAAVADALAYALRSPANGVPGAIEFFCLPLLLVGVGVAAWAQRNHRAFAVLVALCIPLSFATGALLGYWPHGPLLGIAVACCLLAWAPPALAVTGRRIRKPPRAA